MGEAEHREWEKKALSRQRIWKEAEGIMLEAMTKDELYVSQTCHVTYASTEHKLNMYRIGLVLTMSNDQQPQESFGIRRKECKRTPHQRQGLWCRHYISI